MLAFFLDDPRRVCSVAGVELHAVAATDLAFVSPRYEPVAPFRLRYTCPF